MSDGINQDRLKELLRGMDVPEHRKDKVTPKNIKWLIFNLGVRNSEHKNYSAAIEHLKASLKS